MDGFKLNPSNGPGESRLLLCNDCKSCCLFVIGVELFTGDGSAPCGDGVKLFRDADDMLRSTELNGKLFVALAKAGKRGLRSIDG